MCEWKVILDCTDFNGPEGGASSSEGGASSNSGGLATIFFFQVHSSFMMCACFVFFCIGGGVPLFVCEWKANMDCTDSDGSGSSSENGSSGSETGSSSDSMQRDGWGAAPPKRVMKGPCQCLNSSSSLLLFPFFSRLLFVVGVFISHSPAHKQRSWFMEFAEELAILLKRDVELACMQFIHTMCCLGE